MEEPLCADCLACDKVTPATQVHHVIPFVGKDDPLRLDRSNVVSLCNECHDKRHGKVGKLGGVEKVSK